MIQLHKLRIFTAFAQIARKQSFVESRGPTRKQNARARTGATTLDGSALVYAYARSWPTKYLQA